MGVPKFFIFLGSVILFWLNKFERVAGQIPLHIPAPLLMPLEVPTPLSLFKSEETNDRSYASLDDAASDSNAVSQELETETAEAFANVADDFPSGTFPSGERSSAQKEARARKGRRPETKRPSSTVVTREYALSKDPLDGGPSEGGFTKATTSGGPLSSPRTTERLLLIRPCTPRVPAWNHPWRWPFRLDRPVSKDFKSKLVPPWRPWIHGNTSKTVRPWRPEDLRHHKTGRRKKF